MGTSSEDILLSVSNVRYRKRDGTLYFMAERLAWIVNGKDTFSISHNYAEIKMQKISPDGKPKVQLQVVLHNSEASTFQFINPSGRDSQLNDRNDVKELLQQLLPKFRSKITKELEEKNKILEQDSTLLQLYRELVISQVITADEFWANYANDTLLVNKVKTTPQDVGVSASFLSDIKPQTDGCNGLKYNLTADIIRSIFKTYPAVKRKHMENVPDKMSEGEFWTLFFQSHYFHRDRLNTSSKDMFTECAKNDDQEVKREINTGIQNPLVDLSSFADVSPDDGYGTTSTGNSSKGISTNNLSMIRRFNHHSMKVLKACEAPVNIIQVPTTVNNNSLKRAVETDDVTSVVEPDAKKLKVLEKLDYEDLTAEPDANDASLSLHKVERYLHGPVPVIDADYVSSDDVISSMHHLHKDMANWKPQLFSALKDSSAVSVLGELSPGGSLMKNSQNVSCNDSVPKYIRDELKNLYVALMELLRHFWSCFPPTSAFLEEKIMRMSSTVERFYHAKVVPFKTRLLKDHHNVNVVVHLEQMIEVSNKKFQAWQIKCKK